MTTTTPEPDDEMRDLARSLFAEELEPFNTLLKTTDTNKETDPA